MVVKLGSRLYRIMLLLCLISALTLIGAMPIRAEYGWVTKMAQARVDPQAISAKPGQLTTTDRISFYNVPSDHKLEAQIDYLNGQTAKIQYDPALCASGAVITQTLNLYTAKFVAEGCGMTIFQNLNLRWMGDCRFKFEHDPDARMVARGAYGEIVIGEGHYPVGEFQLTNLPANTDSLYATMVFTNPVGNVQTGNVEFFFNQPHPGCSLAGTSTPTSTATPSATPTSTTSTETPSATPTSTNTATPTTTVDTPTPTPTEMLTVTPTVTPTATSTATPTATPTPLPITALDPVDEPKPLTSVLYLPFVMH